jgi:hypothetical protein
MGIRVKGHGGRNEKKGCLLETQCRTEHVRGLARGLFVEECIGRKHRSLRDWIGRIAVYGEPQLADAPLDWESDRKCFVI